RERRLQACALNSASLRVIHRGVGLRRLAGQVGRLHNAPRRESDAVRGEGTWPGHMALDDDIRILERVRLLEDFTHEQLRLLAFGADAMRLQAGRDPVLAGTAAVCALGVGSGP